MNNPIDAAAVINRLPAHAARVLAVEILLSDPEWLADDIVESCLYLLRERLAIPDPSPTALPPGSAAIA